MEQQTERRLLEACQFGDIDAIRSAISSGTRFNCMNDAGQTPIHIAVHYGHIHIVHCLVEMRADVNQISEFGLSPLHMAICHGNPEIVKYLITSGANVYDVDLRGTSALQIAVLYGHRELVSDLIQPDVINRIDRCGNTPINLAADEGHIDVMRLLIEKGADISIPLRNGQNILHTLTLNDNFMVIREVLTCILRQENIGLLR